MAINKKLIHFNKKATFNSQKLSANDANTQYQVGGTGTVQTGAPDINYQSIVYIKDSKEIWTHGQFYATAVTWSTITGKPSFATVATSGNYNDLSNKPTIPTNPNITVTVGGSGNAVTTASFSGTVLTLTKGATYNNYSHPTGSGASKSTGLYKFSTDSTSHISGVTAVTKSDITALGIPSSDTNTTYSFSSGTGSFTVTPSGGSAQTVSIGKPSTAGTADKVANTLTFTGYQSKSYNGSAAVSVAIPSRVSDLTNDSGYITSYTDTKNTTGSTNSSSKLYLVGATSQASSPVTYSNSGVYTQSGAVYASAGFYDTSDMRVKDNIESIDVSKADKIRLVEFDRTDREHHGYGVIAQELETVYPSMVNTDENGFKTVNYSEIYAVKIKYLEDKIAALEAVVDKLISK